MTQIAESLGMNGHFQVLAADTRFSDMPIGLYRTNGGALASYEIVITLEDHDLELVAELADFARERGLRSRFESTGELVLFEGMTE